MNELKELPFALEADEYLRSFQTSADSLTEILNKRGIKVIIKPPHRTAEGEYNIQISRPRGFLVILYENSDLPENEQVVRHLQQLAKGVADTFSIGYAAQNCAYSGRRINEELATFREQFIADFVRTITVPVFAEWYENVKEHKYVGYQRI